MKSINLQFWLTMIGMNKLIVLLIALTSCSSLKVVNTINDKDLNDLIEKKITITGTAINGKLGAMLITEDRTSIWIEGIDSWPAGYYLGGDNGKTLKVTGTLIEKYDLPVFIYKEDESPKSGIPVPEGTDLKEASRRYLLKNADWKIISE